MANHVRSFSERQLLMSCVNTNLYGSTLICDLLYICVLSHASTFHICVSSVYMPTRPPCAWAHRPRESGDTCTGSRVQNPGGSVQNLGHRISDPGSRIENHGFWILVPPNGILDLGSCILHLNPGSRFQDPGSCMLDSESWTQGCGSGILGPKSRILNPGLQDAGSGALDPGPWIRDPGSGILHAGSRILDHDPGAGTLDAGSEIHDLPESWMLEFQQTSWFRVLVYYIYYLYIYIYIYLFIYPESFAQPPR